MNSQLEIIAHRGGTWPGAGENTLEAFLRASEAGIRWLETDAHASADGVLFAAHDDDLARIAGVPHRIRELTSTDLDRIDLIDGGRLPRLGDLFEALPDAHWNIDVKHPADAGLMVRALRRGDLLERVRLASFDSATLRRLRLALPGLATSTGSAESAEFLAEALLSRVRPVRLLPLIPGLDALQVPSAQSGVPVVTRTFVDHAHDRGLLVHVWTINDGEEMRRLANLGVDGIVTDEVLLAQSVFAEQQSLHAE